MATSPTTIIEAFVIDPGFVDETRTINGILVDESGAIATLTQKALSYFTLPSSFTDRRNPISREVNWVAETNPSVIVDAEVYAGFVSTVNALPSSVSGTFFKIVDKLLFSYDPQVTGEEIEEYFLDESDVAEIYVPGSLERSTTIISDTVYYKLGTSDEVDVPAFVKFSLELPSGETTITYTITLFASVEAWLTGYNITKIAKVIPPLPYDRLYSASLSNAVDNVFTTASLTQTLTYNTTKAILGNQSVSGITEFNAVMVDSLNNTVSVPFNILYKGRSPTLSEIREAIRQELMDSGIGTEEGWEARIPGVFVAGRFYIVPYWDMYYTKPDQVLYPSILEYTTLGTKVNQIVDSLGFGDIRQYVDVFPVYYNQMTCASVPDLTGVVDVQTLRSVIPDYQNFSPDEENFSYMVERTRNFINELNTILSIDLGTQPAGSYGTITENLLTFYSFVVGKYEVCVITKVCYETIMESIQ